MFTEQNDIINLFKIYQLTSFRPLFIITYTFISQKKPGKSASFLVVYKITGWMQTAELFRQKKILFLIG